MTRAIGYHLLGDEVAYALIEKLDAAPPQVLAAGRVPFAEIENLADRLDARRMPWALAAEEDGRMKRDLPDGWPHPDRGEEVLTAPSVAAAFWDWEHGRVDVDDLYLWLSARSVHWSRGLPGRGRAGSVPRVGPLRESLKPALARVQADRNPVALFVEGDAPGGDLVEDLVRKQGHPVRPLMRPAEEMGADPAAAGAALAAMSETFPALYPAVRPDRTAAWRRAMGIWVWALAGLGVLLHFRQEHALSTWGTRAALEDEAGAIVSPIAPPPAALEKLLLRRAAVLEELDTSSDQALQSLRIFTDPQSADIRTEQEASGR